ncbi:MAG TPA: RpiB/LacA/LacB family sugar-phosphate isomerase [Candidatus Saccharibacteria bacterium]|nr:RpiB/LacA/LacB family sugar-phosphate isomerase [Candidatus Saccharibacteria bacterium]
MNKKIFIGADHNGFQLKEKLEQWLKTQNYEVVDAGDERLNPDDDYPEFASKLVTLMLSSEEPEPMGILLCGSGQGMAMAANRFKGIRAALVWNKKTAEMSRHDDDANVLCLSAWELNEEAVIDVTQTWLQTPYGRAARYIRRIKELDSLN